MSVEEELKKDHAEMQAAVDSKQKIIDAQVGHSARELEGTRGIAKPLRILTGGASWEWGGESRLVEGLWPPGQSFTQGCPSLSSKCPKNWQVWLDCRLHSLGIRGSGCLECLEAWAPA